MSLEIQYDEARDELTICGIKYSGDIFRQLGVAEVGTWLRIEDRRDGVVTVFAVPPDTNMAFDLITGKGAVSGVI